MFNCCSSDSASTPKNPNMEQHHAHHNAPLADNRAANAQNQPLNRQDELHSGEKLNGAGPAAIPIAATNQHAGPTHVAHSNGVQAASDFDRMSASGGMHQVLKTESIPITVQRVYEQPVTIETKEYVPVVVEKTLQHEAIVRKTETIPATIEKREWVAGVQDAKVVGAQETVMQQGNVREVDERIKSVGAPIDQTAGAREMHKGEFRQVDSSVISTDQSGRRLSSDRDQGAGHIHKSNNVSHNAIPAKHNAAADQPRDFAIREGGMAFTQ